MSRPSRYQWYQFYSFPRVSGDEPAVSDGGRQTTTFSPRERG